MWLKKRNDRRVTQELTLYATAHVSSAAMQRAGG